MGARPSPSARRSRSAQASRSGEGSCWRRCLPSPPVSRSARAYPSAPGWPVDRSDRRWGRARGSALAGRSAHGATESACRRWAPAEQPNGPDRRHAAERSDGKGGDQDERQRLGSNRERVIAAERDPPAVGQGGERRPKPSAAEGEAGGQRRLRQRLGHDGGHDSIDEPTDGWTSVAASRLSSSRAIASDSASSAVVGWTASAPVSSLGWKRGSSSDAFAGREVAQLRQAAEQVGLDRADRALRLGRDLGQ